MNEALKPHRILKLHAAPCERYESRCGYAKGVGSKTVASRPGKLQFAVPQTRGTDVYPSVPKRGERSERTLKVTMADIFYMH